LSTQNSYEHQHKQYLLAKYFLKYIDFRQDYFKGWGEQGTIDLKQELEKLLVLISSRCLLGKEVREKIFDEFFTQFHEMTDSGTSLTSVLFPYAPTSTNRRRDRARAKLSEMLTRIVRLRKSSSNNVEDILQNLIDSKYRDGRPTTEPEVIGLMIALLMAGKQTELFH
jgi:sterol 14alpha-demethylase